MKLAYDESELVQNRASLLIFGGTVAERRAWAEEAQRAFADEGPLAEVTTAAELTRVLAGKRGVVYVPDLPLLGAEAQAQVMRCLQIQEERPKLILGLARPSRAAIDDGALRDDLHYRLSRARVDLSSPDVQAGINRRRAAHPAPGKSRHPEGARASVGAGVSVAARAPRAPAKVKPPSRGHR